MSLVISAQQTNTASLNTQLVETKEDTTKVKIFLELMSSYESSEPEKALQYGKMAHTLSEKINFYTGKIRASRGLGKVFVIQGKLDSALYYHQYSLKHAQENKDSINIGASLLKIGSTYRRMSDFKNALDYATKAIKIIESYGDKTSIAEMNDALQLIYFSLPNYEKAILYGSKAVSQARELKNKPLLMQALSNLTLSYNETKRFKESKKALVEAQALATELQDLNAESAILLNLAGVFLKQGDYKTLKEYANKALIINKKIGSTDGECVSLRALAISYLHEKEYLLAKDYALNALEIAEANNYKTEMGDCYKLLSNISFAMQNLEDGERYYEKSNAMIEEIFNEAYLQSAAQFEKKYETEEKDSKIKLQSLKLNQKNILNYIFIGSSIALLLFILLLYRNYSHKQKLQFHRISELEKEKQLTATEAVLKGEEQERIRLAKDLHDGLGGMLSGIKYSFQTIKQNLIMTPDNQMSFERSMDMLDSSIKEMRRVAHNMMPESLVKFGLDTAAKDFCNEINTSGALKINYQSMGMSAIAIDQTTAITMYRVLQELINNIIKHASAKTAIVQFTFTDTVLTLTVEDDGKGFYPENLNQTKGMGWANIKNRINFLGGVIHIDSKPGKGTSVHIEIN
ncbi:sensor histidine kinase [Flavobacteriaceae bacterium KMM 6897]|nr:sensor histidine kinase [Flavobacteriaceae bacterium KMM 6897]